MANANRDINRKSEGPDLGDELRLLQKFYPIKNGLRIRARAEKANRNVKYARLHLLIESNGEVELHVSGFEKREAKNSAWWARYFSTKVFKGVGGKSKSPSQRLGVLEGSIISGIRRTTRLHWTVKMVVGYSLHDRR